LAKKNTYRKRGRRCGDELQHGNQGVCGREEAAWGKCALAKKGKEGRAAKEKGKVKGKHTFKEGDSLRQKPGC